MQNFKWSNPNFICHVLHKLNVMYVTKLDSIIFFALCSYWKKLSVIVISINRVFFQCICFKSVCKILSEKILFALTFLKKVDSLMSHMSRYDHKEDIRIYSLDSFFFLRIVFDIFNFTFHFSFLKFKFWGGFPSKIFFWMSCMSHESGP